LVDIREELFLTTALLLVTLLAIAQIAQRITRINREMRKQSVALSAIIIVSVILSSTLLVNAADNYWIIKAPTHIARAGAGIATVNETIYVIGGSQTQNYSYNFFSVTLNATEAYDTGTDIWTEKTSMPTSRSRFGTAVYRNKIYCIGGLILSKNGTKTTLTSINEVYDPSTDTWETKTSMPTARNGFMANMVDGKIYLIGGWYQLETTYGNVGTTAHVDVYDPSTDTWTTGKSMPKAVAIYSSAVVDNKIYVISGTADGSAITNLTQIYDPKMDSWSLGAPIPVGVTNAGAGAITGTNLLKAIYVVGGSDAGAPLNGQITNQVYSVETDSWSMGEPMPMDKAGLSATVVNNTLFVIGGGHNIFTPDSTTNMQYIPLSGVKSESLPTIPIATVVIILIITIIGIVVFFKKYHRK
jgi:N-acetylneuraminic acid mutarotase